jgi:zinc resistance-associated protein
MWKVLVVGSIALAFAGSSIVFAQQAPAPSATSQQASAASNTPPRWTADDAAAFSDAHIAALKASLALKSDQEKGWQPFEATLRDLDKQRTADIAKLIAERKSAAGAADPIAILRERADAMSISSANLKRLADAAEPLYKSLDDAQKRRMFVLFTGTRPAQ